MQVKDYKSSSKTENSCICNLTIIVEIYKNKKISLIEIGGMGIITYIIISMDCL